MAEIRLREVVKTYGAFVAVNRVDLTIGDGEFVALVGPSGCGKTTTLNLIAGLIEISGGEIWIGDRLVNDLDPMDRDIAMVFQNYALYPHKTIAKNLAFPLQMRKLPRDEIERKVREAARMLEIEHLMERLPRELSGGQQQRVALGRALVRDPRAFLMDEPLSNLDAKLRVQMRTELKRFHQQLGSTIVYVTHDQLEAVTLSDRIAVMNGGLLQQYDSPEKVFNSPANTFVAGFIGSPAMNLLNGKRDGGTVVFGEGRRFRLPEPLARQAAEAGSEALVLGVRHSSIRLDEMPQDNSVPGTVYIVEPTGDVTFVHVRIGADTAVVSVPPDMRLRPDTDVHLSFDERRLHLFDGASGRSLAPA